MNLVERIKNVKSKSPRIKINGSAGSGKSTVLMERYRYMIETLRISSESILVLIKNHKQQKDWRRILSLKESGKLLITSFNSFIRDEIDKYYPIILNKNTDINVRSLRPIFLNFEISQYLISKVIEKKRLKSLLFSEIKSSNARIAGELISNMVKASTSGIDFNEVGKRLFMALEKKDDVRQKIFDDCDLISGDYRKKCIELGIFDLATTIDIYKKFLLTDSFYKGQLCKRIRHLIVDDADDLVQAEVDFINEMEKELESCFIAHNVEGGYGDLKGSNFEYSESLLNDGFQEIKLEGSKTCSSFMFEFSDMLFENISKKKDFKLKKGVEIEKIASEELRSDMLEAVGNKILDLINNQGYVPNDIAVISTYADYIAEIAIENILKLNEIYLNNIARKSLINEVPVLKSMLTLTKICHPKLFRFPSINEVDNLIKVILDIDPVRSSRVAVAIMKSQFGGVIYDTSNEILEIVGEENFEKYELLCNRIDELKSIEESMTIDYFLKKLYSEIYEDIVILKDDLIFIAELIKKAKQFVKVIGRFGRNTIRDFIEMSENGICIDNSMIKKNDQGSNSVIFSTPKLYIDSGLSHKIIILVGISSKNWVQRSIKELTNVHVLKNTWNIEEIYTEDIEEEMQKKYLSILMRNIIKRCGERLITLESEYSSGGYENDGVLSEYFEEIIGQ